MSVERRGPAQVKLAGFNNLTKCLSFNLYDFCIARNDEQRRAYAQDISKRYCAEKMGEISKGICEIIEAEMLEISLADYLPYGASTLVLMSDLAGGEPPDHRKSASVHAHLDKSHICAHTYPDTAGPSGVCSFRVDIDIATCGEITPMKALNYMFSSFEADVVIMDYVVRGYTRDTEGRKVYNDQPFSSIRDFIAPETLKGYVLREDLNIPQANIWQTKLLRADRDPAEYFLDAADYEPGAGHVEPLLESLHREMREIYYMHRV